jgi:DNA-binding transcriptional MerR regulator
MTPRQTESGHAREAGLQRSNRAPADGRANGSRLLRIGDLASQTDVTVEALRYYERRGLLSSAHRRENGYREYPPDAVRLVWFIKRAQSLGFTLAEVEELVRLRERAWTGDATSLLRAATVAKVHDIDQRMRQLRALRRELMTLVAECDAACPVPPVQHRGTSAKRVARDGTTVTETPDPFECPLVDALDPDEPNTVRSKSGRKQGMRPTTTIHSPKPGGERKR